VNGKPLNNRSQASPSAFPQTCSLSPHYVAVIVENMHIGIKAILRGQFCVHELEVRKVPDGATRDSSHRQVRSTSNYRIGCLHSYCFSRDCNLQIVLNTDSEAGDLRNQLAYIYECIYVEFVVKNPLYVPGRPVE